MQIQSTHAIIDNICNMTKDAEHLLQETDHELPVMYMNKKTWSTLVENVANMGIRHENNDNWIQGRRLVTVDQLLSGYASVDVMFIEGSVLGRAVGREKRKVKKKSRGFNIYRGNFVL